MLKKKSPYTNTIIGYCLATAVGVLVGLRISPSFFAVPYMMLGVLCIYFTFQNEVNKMLCLLPYLIYSEIFMRAYVLEVPYLFLQYLFIIIFTLLILRRAGKVKVYSRVFIFLFLFILVELINSSR